MGRHKRRRRDSSDSSSDSANDNDYRKREPHYEEERNRQAMRIMGLERLIRELRQTATYHGTRPSTSSSVVEVPASVPSVEPTTSAGNTTQMSFANPPTTVPTIRYVGRNDSVPEFDPEKTTISVEHWIRSLESIANMYGWDERTLICNCTTKLKGYAKGWYERQQNFDVDWSEWKSRLIKAFPFTKNKLSQIRELVNRVKKTNEDPIQFYYDKLGIGMACGMPDEVIAEAIIGTLGDKLSEVGAVSAGCRDTSSLLKYLASIKTVDTPKEDFKQTDQAPMTTGKVTCYICGKKGHKARVCHSKKAKWSDAKRCHFCQKVGHLEENCYKKKNKSKICGFCSMTGHSYEECRRRINQRPHTGNTNERPAKKVQIICPDESDQKYYKTALINNAPVQAYVDFGSARNTMVNRLRQKLNLELKKDESNVVLKGYGGSLIIPLGKVSGDLTVDGVTSRTDFLVVENQVQAVETIIGQPFTEAPNVIMVKTPTELTIYDSEVTLELPELCENLSKFSLYPKTDVMLAPGINKIVVMTDPPLSGVLGISQAEHRKPSKEMDVLGGPLEVQDGSAVIKLVNMTTTTIPLKSDHRLARGEITDEVHSGPRFGKALTEHERGRLDTLLEEFEHCFAGDCLELGKCNIEMKIKLLQDKIINYKPYRLSYHERELVRTKVAEMMEAGIIEESKSPYASPIILVPKKEGGHRMCVDYRALNKITEKERYPLPVIQDQLDRLVDKKCFSSLDLANGYHQIRIAEESKPYTAFITPDGLYHFKMMSFGLCNAPATFQRAMNHILAPVLHSCAEVYIDDVIIWGKDVQEGLVNLRKVLELISEAGVKLKLSKCSFLTESIEYLGHVICNGEIRPSMYKIKAVENFKTPTNVHELRQFLGLASYFRKFINRFATVAQPLTKLTRKDQYWTWGEQQENAIQALKLALTSDPVLAIFAPNKETQVHTDASKIGLAGILLQKQPSGIFKPVAYASRQTTAAERNYHSFELEALAVVFSIMKFKVYLTGAKFSVVTDCSALRLAWSKRDLSARIARWWLDLQEFDFEVEHRPGTVMAHADALSRNPIDIRQVEEKDLVDALQEADEGIQQLVQNVKLEVSAGKNKKSGLSKEYEVKEGRLYRITDGGLRPVLPRSARWHILKTYHDQSGHLGVEKCLEAIRAKYWFSKMRKCVEKYVKSCIGCQFTKKPTGKQPGLLHPIPRVEVPFHTLHIDHLGPFCKSAGKAYIVVIIDGFSKFLWLEAVASPNAKGAINALSKVSSVFGHPVRIISDKGTAFTGREFQMYCHDHGIKHVQNAVATPRANGQVERSNRTILQSLTAHMNGEEKGWEKYLPNVQLGINSSICQGTGKTPLQVLCGLRPRLSGDLQGAIQCAKSLTSLRDDAGKSIKKNAVEMERSFNRSRRAVEPLALGTLVMVERKILRPGLTSGKLVPRYAGPYKVSAVLPNDRYEVISAKMGKRGYKNVVARDKMKVWVSRDIDSCDEE